MLKIIASKKYTKTPQKRSVEKIGMNPDFIPYCADVFWLLHRPPDVSSKKLSH